MFCNYVGLPDLSFAQPGSREHKWRRVIWAAYFVGVVGFVKGFKVVGGVEKPGGVYGDMVASIQF